MTLKGLPATYNKGLQEFVEPLLDHVKTVGDSIQIAEGVLSTLATQPEKMRAALDPFMLVTDVADYLVRKGVAFRETPHQWPTRGAQRADGYAHERAYV